MFKRLSTVGPAAAEPPAAVHPQAESSWRPSLLQELARAFSLGFIVPPSAAYVWRMPERLR
jgi:hypothetical protein